jgi:hypothetical protein
MKDADLSISVEGKISRCQKLKWYKKRHGIRMSDLEYKEVFCFSFFDTCEENRKYSRL